MDYQTAIEAACKHAHKNANEQARSDNYGGTYLKHLATARFFELVAEHDIDISDRSIGSISVDMLRGVSAIESATDDDDATAAQA